MYALVDDFQVISWNLFCCFDIICINICILEVDKWFQDSILCCFQVQQRRYNYHSIYLPWKMNPYGRNNGYIIAKDNNS